MKQSCFLLHKEQKKETNSIKNFYTRDVFGGNNSFYLTFLKANYWKTTKTNRQTWNPEKGFLRRKWWPLGLKQLRFFNVLVENGDLLGENK